MIPSAGRLAFIVALVIHEFGHGLLARGHGCAFAPLVCQLGPLPSVPLRAAIRGTPASAATGTLAHVCCRTGDQHLAAMIPAATGWPRQPFAAAEEGVHIRGVVVGTGAEEAGLEPWDRIVAIDDMAIVDDSSFTEALSTLQAGETVTLTLVNLEGNENR